MRQLTTFVALASFAVAPLQAASASGLALHGQPSGAATRSVGAVASVTLRLGGENYVRTGDRMKLGFAAGPVLSIHDKRAAGGVRRSVASLAGFTLRPGHSASLTLAGQPLMTRYGPKMVVHDLQPRKAAPEGKRLNGFGKTAAFVALGAGVLVAAVLIAVNVDCNTGDGCTS